MPFDNLYIKIFSIDEKTSKIFNSSDDMRNSLSTNLISYVVDENGNINFKTYDPALYRKEINDYLCSSLASNWRYENLSRKEFKRQIGIKVEYSMNRTAFFFQPRRSRFLKISYSRYDSLYSIKTAIEFILPKCEFFESKLTPVQQLFYKNYIFSYGWLSINPKDIIFS